MKPHDYVKLEKDYSFKKSYLDQTLWWKNILIIPPICLLFVGLVGILYLFNVDKLVSIYIIPYVAVFAIGTIWLKAIKKHIQKVMMTAHGAFNICLAKPIGEKDGYTYVAFTNDHHRHDKYYINNLVNDISLEKLLLEQKVSLKRKSVQITHDKESGASFYIRAYFNKDIDKRNASWRENDHFPVLYIDERYTPIIKKRDLVKQ